MTSLNLTGHYILDAALAASAALLEDYDKRKIETPQQMSGADVLRALELAEQHFYSRQVPKEKDGDLRPLFYFLLQEILPGSPWDQVKSGAVSAGMQRKFAEYIVEAKSALLQPAVGKCYLSGQDGHLLVSKSNLPMLASSGERPNCFPNLSDGLTINGYLALAVLLSPLGIEKTLNDKGKGGQNLVYHATNWRFMVSIAKANIDRIRRLLASNSIEAFRAHHYPKFRRGSWKKGLQTLIHATQNIPADARPQVVIWSFNASNQTCRYECRETSDAFLIIAAQRRLQPALYRELLRVSDYVARLILQSQPIIGASLTRDKKYLEMRPGWPFQRFYAEKVLSMSPISLNCIEDAALALSAEKEAVNYCLYEEKRLDIRVLADRYKLPPSIVACFATMPAQWPDYLRAALIWADKGNVFEPRQNVAFEPQELETKFKEIAPRLANIGSYKLAARLLNQYNPRAYRQSWIRLISRKAATWEDFLFFNPIEEAFGNGDYARTSTLRHYLVAYLLACVHQQPENATVSEPDEAEVERDVQQIERETSLAFDDEIEEELT